MTKPTDSKVTAAFQAMLAFLQYVLTGRYGGVYTLATRYGVDAAMSLLVVGDRATLLALRDLVQAADDEHAGSAAPAAPSDEEEAFRALRLSDIKDNHARAEVSFTGAACTNAHLDRAWLIGEVERLRAMVASLERQSSPPDERPDLDAPEQAALALPPGAVLVEGVHGPKGWAQSEAGKVHTISITPEPYPPVVDLAIDPAQPALPGLVCAVCQKPIVANEMYAGRVGDAAHRACMPAAAALGASFMVSGSTSPNPLNGPAPVQPSATLHIGVDPAQPGSDRTVTQVREPAFDRLAAAVGMLRRTRFTDDMAVVQAFDAFVAARAAEVEPATPAETLTFTRLKGETPEQFRARIALHLNGMGSTPFVLPGQDGTREALGEIVRGVWIQWAKEQPSLKPSWLVPWEGLSEPDKEVDRRIGVALATVGQGFAGAIDAPVLTEEAAQKWAEGMCGAADLAAPADAVTEALLAAARGEYPTT